MICINIRQLNNLMRKQKRVESEKNVLKFKVGAGNLDFSYFRVINS